LECGDWLLLSGEGVRLAHERQGGQHITLVAGIRTVEAGDGEKFLRSQGAVVFDAELDKDGGSQGAQYDIAFISVFAQDVCGNAVEKGSLSRRSALGTSSRG
jgi:hypothetical protein